MHAHGHKDVATLQAYYPGLLLGMAGAQGAGRVDRGSKAYYLGLLLGMAGAQVASHVDRGSKATASVY